jgi:hypothetical protein
VLGLRDVSDPSFAVHLEFSRNPANSYGYVALSVDSGTGRLQNHVDLAQLIMMSELSHAWSAGQRAHNAGRNPNPDKG